MIRNIMFILVLALMCASYASAETVFLTENDMSQLEGSSCCEIRQGNCTTSCTPTGFGVYKEVPISYTHATSYPCANSGSLAYTCWRKGYHDGAEECEGNYVSTYNSPVNLCIQP